MRHRSRKIIERHLPSVGTILVASFGGKRYHAEIIESPNLPEGRAVKSNNVSYSSMSGAAQAITRRPTNGWLFWKISHMP